MANTWYPKAKEALGTQSPAIDLDDNSTTTIKAYLVRSGAYNAAHQYLSDLVGAGATLVANFALTSRTFTLGVFDAADGTFTAVASGTSCSAIVIAKDTGSNATSALLVWIDTATNLPITPNGGDLACTWDNGSSKIAAI